MPEDRDSGPGMAADRRKSARRPEDAGNPDGRGVPSFPTADADYRGFFDNAVEGFFRSTPQGRFLLVNPAFARILGYATPEELLSSISDIGEQFYEDPEDRRRYMRLLEREGAVSRFEFPARRRDGSRIWVSNSTRAIRDPQGTIACYEGILQDVTARKAAEESLREREALYRSVIDNIQDVFYRSDREGRLLMGSPSGVALFGYDDIGEMIGLPLESFWANPAERGQLVAEMRGKGAVRDFEALLKRKDGTIFYGAFTTHFYRNEKGDILGTEGIIRDITERKLAEEAIRKRNEVNRRLVETSPDPIVMYDLQGNFLAVNERTARIYGAESVETFLSEVKNIAGLLDETELSRALAHFRTTLREGRSERTEYLVRLRDGRRIPVEIHSSVVTDDEGRPAAFISIVRDITERRQAEEALRESEERLRMILDAAQESIFIKDLDLRYRLVNRAMERLFHMSAGEILGKTDGDLFGEEANRHILEVDGQVLRGQVREEEHAKPVRGVMHTFHVVKTPLRDRQGRITGLCGVARDITERKRLEAELQQAQKLEAIGTLAGGIAHDFNNVLMGIQGYASLIKVELDPAGRHFERLERIEEQIQSGAALTRQLLGFAQGGRYEVHPLDVNEVLSQTASLFGRTKKEISIHMDFQDDLWAVAADRGQMEQVFMNLCVNAWQAMPAGGDLSLETRNVGWTATDPPRPFPPPGRYVRISVADTGVGMDARTRERIFDPFFTTKAMGRGAGLGLATVYGIVKGHAGWIDVQSEPGQGARFVIHLPASDAPVVRQPPALEKPLSGGETVLVVDDERIVLDVTREMLRSLGYRVLSAGSGQEALAAYMAKRPEIRLVILDMVMPGISGGETFDRLRAIDPAVPVLLSSGYSIDGEAQELLDRGCRAFLQKPFQLQDLSRKVREALDA